MKKIFNAVKKWFYIKNDTEQQEINKQLIVIVVSIFITVVSVLGVTYSAFVWSDNSLKNQSLIVGNIELSINSSSEALGSNLNYPVAKEDETSLTPYIFTIKNNGTLSSSYKLKIVADDAYTNTMDTNYIYMSMTGGRIINRTPLSSYSEIPFDEGILASGESKTYDLRLWIIENAPNSVIGKEWHGKIVLESTQTDIIADIDVSDLTLVSDSNINTEAKNIEFTIKNSEDIAKYLQLNLDEIAISEELKNSYFKWRLLDGEIVINEGDFNGIAKNKLLQRSIEITANQEKTYNLWIWYSDRDTSGIDLTGKTLTAKVTAELNDNLNTIALSESPVLINTIANNPIKNFKIFGNSIQDGIPTTETPVEIESVGDYDSTTGKYIIPIEIGGRNIADLTQVQKFVDGMQALGTAYYGYMTNIIIDDNGRSILKLYAASGYNNANYSELRKILTGPFKEKTQYTLSFEFYKGFNGAYMNLFIQYTDGTTGNIMTSGSYTANTTTNLTFTSTKNKTIDYIGLNYNQSSTYIYLDTLQLQEGSTIIDITTTNIYLDEPLRKIGDYVDYIDFENQKVVRNVEVIDNTGSLSLEESLRGLETPIEESILLPSPVTINGITNITITTKVKPMITGYY